MRDFVNRALDEGPAVDDAGRQLALWARDTLAPRAKKGTLPFDGFKQNLIAGGQNGWAMVHIAGVAGVTLVGDHKSKGLYGPTGYQIRDQQFAQDREQLQKGLDLRAAGHKTLDGLMEGDYPNNYPTDKFIEEKQAEIADDEAGVAAGDILRSAYAGRIRRADAISRISQLICDK